MASANLAASIERAHELLERATAVGVLTGAGISAESGIPTFRDALTGLWSRYRPDELATPEAFAADPKRVWGWYAWRREVVARAMPNAGHQALAALEGRCRDREVEFTLITQNVDGLHRAAGSSRIIELHGNIGRVKCFESHHPVDSWSRGEEVPTCPRCGSLLRPDVVWFGEALPHDELAAAFAAARSCDVFLCVGTSAVVVPAASLPFIALEAGARVIEVNPQPTSLTQQATVSVRGTAGDILPQLVGNADLR